MTVANLGSITRSITSAITWVPILAGSATMLAIAAWARLTQPDHADTGARLGTILLVTGLAFASEVSAANTTSACPVAFRRRWRHDRSELLSAG